ncbi:hypothetical protein, partial [Streptomyces viridosporus]|uniref:hypothetical protein n=1 Tax=Streptomyces viridosporus TaxID=67581 RepID=UPI0033326E0C
PDAEPRGLRPGGLMTGGGGPGPDTGGGHIGLAVTAIALGGVAHFSGVHRTLTVAGCCAAWFLLALTVLRLRGGRGRQAVRRAYQ